MSRSIFLGSGWSSSGGGKIIFRRWEDHLHQVWGSFTEDGRTFVRRLINFLQLPRFFSGNGWKFISPLQTTIKLRSEEFLGKIAVNLKQISLSTYLPVKFPVSFSNCAVFDMIFWKISSVIYMLSYLRKG